MSPNSPHTFDPFPRIVLASASPRRVELLGRLGVPFDVVPSDTEEVEGHQLTAAETAQWNAFRKARTVACLHPEALVIGADTVVWLDTICLGKPRDLEEAERTLEQLQGRTHQVVTGVCMIHGHFLQSRLFAETTYVAFRPLDHEDIRRYLRSINPLDKAGAYAIQEHGDLLVEEINGSYSNVVGLPMERLQEELLDFAAFPVHPLHP